jgi:Spy/CpxP family protein refolding chaperone
MARKYGLLILCGFLAAALLASEAQAQPGGGRRGGRGPGGMMAGAGGLLRLAENAQVQKELEIVDDQKTKLADLATQQQTARQDLQNLSQEERAPKIQKNQEDSLKKLGEILLPKQLERLKQIQLQVQGADALSNEDVVKALNITDDQKAKMKTISDEAATKLQDALANLNGPERFTKMQELNKQLLDKLLAVLTPDQVAKFDTMKGPKLDIDPATLMRGNRGARGGGGGGRRGGGGGGAGGGAGG